MTARLAEHRLHLPRPTLGLAPAAAFATAAPRPALIGFCTICTRCAVTSDTTCSGAGSVHGCWCARLPSRPVDRRAVVKSGRRRIPSATGARRVRRERLLVLNVRVATSVTSTCTRAPEANAAAATDAATREPVNCQRMCGRGRLDGRLRSRSSSGSSDAPCRMLAAAIHGGDCRPLHGVWHVHRTKVQQAPPVQPVQKMRVRSTAAALGSLAARSIGEFRPPVPEVG